MRPWNVPRLRPAGPRLDGGIRGHSINEWELQFNWKPGTGRRWPSHSPNEKNYRPSRDGRQAFARMGTACMERLLAVAAEAGTLAHQALWDEMNLAIRVGDRLAQAEGLEAQPPE